MSRSSWRSCARALSIAVLIVGTVFLSGPGAAHDDEILEQDVLFGIPRQALVSGFLDFEAGCHVTASYEAVAVRDGSSAPSFLSTAPGACDMAVYILGIRVPIISGGLTPLDRTSYYVPGVGGITFGLADVSVDLVTTLHGELARESTVLAASPSAMDWPTWGMVPATITAHAGQRGSTLLTSAPYTLSLALGVGVSVYLLGFRIYSWVTSVAAVAGTPVVELPVAIDLAPSPAAITDAVAGSPYSLRLAWTENQDDDFAAYEISVSGGSANHVFLVRDATRTSLQIDAAAATKYTIQITVVDESGQRAVSVSSSVTTPTPPTSSPAPGLESPAWFLLLAAGIVVGLGTTRLWQHAGSRRRNADAPALQAGRVLALPAASEGGTGPATPSSVEAQVRMLASAFVAGRVNRDLFVRNLERIRGRSDT